MLPVKSIFDGSQDPICKKLNKTPAKIMKIAALVRRCSWFFFFFMWLGNIYTCGFFKIKYLAKKIIFLSEGTLLRGEEIQYEQIKNEVDDILNEDFRKRLNYGIKKQVFIADYCCNLCSSE